MSTRQTLGRWIKVKPDNYVEPTEDVEPGVFVSPYDIPNGIRVGYDEGLGRFVAEFHYMVDEKYRRLSGDGVRYRLGKHSGRIIGVETGRQDGQMSVRIKDNEDAYQAILEAMGNVGTVVGNMARGRENHVVAKRVLEDYQDVIVQGMLTFASDTAADRVSRR